MCIRDRFFQSMGSFASWAYRQSLIVEGVIFIFILISAVSNIVWALHLKPDVLSSVQGWCNDLKNWLIAVLVTHRLSCTEGHRLEIMSLSIRQVWPAVLSFVVTCL